MTIRWRTTNTVNVTDLLPTATEGVRPVIGLITMEVTEGSESNAWKIHTVYSEFDAGAWLQNLMDADICHNPEKNLGAPPVAGATTSTMGAAPTAAMTSAAGTGPMAAVVSGSAGVVQEAPVATAAPMMKRARMYI